MTTDVKMKLVAENQASPAINKVKQDLAGLDKQAGTAAGGLSGLAKVAGAAGLVAFGVQAARAATELAELGNASRSMKAAFEDVAGSAENATAIIEALQQASRGTISEFDLMQAASKGVLLGVADTADEFSALMEIAIVRGKALGLSAQQAFSDLVTGLGRESALILDNLGIIVDVEKATNDYAATLGKTADQLTATERKQALVNQVMANSATLLDDANQSADALAGEGMASLTAAWTDFRTVLGESIGEVLDARYRELAEFLRAGAEELDRQRAAVGLTEGTSASGLTDGIGAVLTIDLDNAKAQLAELQAAMIDMASNAEAHIRAIYASTPGLSMAEAGAIFQSTLDGIITAIAETEAKIADLEGKLQGVVETAPEFQVFIPTFGAMADAAGGAAAAVGEIARAIRAVEREAGASAVFQKYMTQSGAGDAAGGKFGALGGLASRRFGGIGGRGITGGPTDSYGPELSFGGGGGISSIDNELNALTSRVQGVLQGSLKSGIDLDSILPRADSIEEDARRLADVAVKGYDSPWASYFKDKFPELFSEITAGGDIKQSAAEVLRQFEAGLRPELLNKDLAKQRIKAALLGEQNVAALAAEIAAELSAEMGVSLAQAQQAASGVLGTGATTGDGTGMDGGAAATVYTDNFVATMAAMLGRFQGTGTSAGGAFQVGFLAATSTMPQAILGNLASLLLPMLQAALAGQTSRTGAS